jgi:hypothetical protein
MEEAMVMLHMEQKEAFPLAVMDGIKMLQTEKKLTLLWWREWC